MYSSPRVNLYTEMNKLQEANILLREKNLQLNQQLHTKSRYRVLIHIITRNKNRRRLSFLYLAEKLTSLNLGRTRT